MNSNRFLILILAVIATGAMLLYPPYIITATGSDLGYHFVFQKPVMVEALGSMNKGRLLLQAGGLWALTIVLLFFVRR